MATLLGVNAGSIYNVYHSWDSDLMWIGDVELHPLFFETLAIALTPLTVVAIGWLLYQVIDQWLFESRRRRIARFASLEPDVDRIMQKLYRDARDMVKPDDRHANIELLQLTSELNSGLHPLGVGGIGPLDLGSYQDLSDMMERGALKEAAKRFPLPKRSY